jgi:hypothetical protein
MLVAGGTFQTAEYGRWGGELREAAAVEVAVANVEPPSPPSQRLLLLAAAATEAATALA